MAKRLISLKQIREEKIPRSRGWFYAAIAAGEFPRPLDQGPGGGPNLWDEELVDSFISDFIAAAKRRAGEGAAGGAKRVEKAAAARAARTQAAQAEKRAA